MKKKKSFSKLYLYGAIGCIAVIAIVGYKIGRAHV